MHSPPPTKMGKEVNNFGEKLVGEGQKVLILKEGLRYDGVPTFPGEVRNFLGKMQNCTVTVEKINHCVKIVHIWSYAGLYFPAFGLNMQYSD